MYKDYQIRTHQAEWAQKRAVAKIETDRQISAINDEKNRLVKKINDELEDEIKKISADAADRIMKAKLNLYERLKEIAQEQDEFEDEFRNYVATLPNQDNE